MNARSFFNLAACFGIFPSLAAEPLRELSTDRPDVTESPYSVGKGQFQFEIEMVSLIRDGGDWTEYTLGLVNARFGITNNLDFQVTMPLYTHVHDGDEGNGDTQVFLEYYLWGNDGGDTAMSLMPFVKIPTARRDLGNHEIEGGIIVPFSFYAPGDWSCGLMGEVDFTPDEEGSYYLIGLVSASASHGITEYTAGFLEIVCIFSAESSNDIEAYFNTGVIWGITENWQIDGGVRVGLTSASLDLSPFVGLITNF